MNKIFHIGSTFKAFEEDNDLHIAGMASTNGTDRVGDVIETEAWTKGGLNNYLNNPVILFNHDYNQPIGRAIALETNDKGLQLKAKIAKLKREQEDKDTKKSSAKTDGFDVRRTGDATVVFIGLPSVGKSTLLNKLTGAKSTVGAFQFTTLTVVPGMMEYRGAKIQVLDLPGIIKGASTGKGLGKRILSVARTADLVLLVLDVFQPYHEDVLVNELGNIGIRLNTLPPNITIEKSAMGGIAVAQQVKLTKITEKHLKDLLHIYGIVSARVVIREDVTSEQVADYIAGNVSYSKALTVLNKIDLVDKEFLTDLKTKLKTEVLAMLLLC